jgi:hypothetical protein
MVYGRIVNCSKYQNDFNAEQYQSTGKCTFYEYMSPVTKNLSLKYVLNKYFRSLNEQGGNESCYNEPSICSQYIEIQSKNSCYELYSAVSLGFQFKGDCFVSVYDHGLFLYLVLRILCESISSVCN